MLRELHISNLAVITDARIELHPGFNCFTGATGAGKSLVIGAIELLLGLRSHSDMLRAGEDEARVSGVFEIIDPRSIHLIESTCDLPVKEDNSEILLTRRIFASGRSSVSLNGRPITLAMLRSVAQALVDVHGQHDQQYLLKPSNQLDVLDAFASLTAIREKYHTTYQQLQQIKAQIEALESNSKLRLQQLDFARFQATEIDAAELRIGEYDELSARSQVLNNLEKLRKEAGAVHAALHESDSSLLDRLRTMTGVLSELAMVDQALSPIANTVKEATMQLAESAFDLGRYLDRLDLDPAEIAEVSERLNTINRILKKYGPTVEATLEERESLGRQITELERAGEDTESLSKQVAPLTAKLSELSLELSSKRKVAARKLTPLIESQLAELGMEKARFSIAISATDPRASGIDDVEFVIQTNPGLPASPLAKIASGGELGRIMLALKSVLAAGDRVSVLVFDEIDANIGGRLGAVIGNKLRDLSRHHQILCITHLPQIASYSDRHFTVRKESKEKETRTTVRPVDGDVRIEELAEMIGGHRITQTTRAQAMELLQSASPVTAKPSKRKK